MKILTFEEQFEVYLEEQKKGASPRRLEMLERDLSGTVKLFKEGLWPVFQTFEGFVLEYEIIGPNGVRIFIDVFYAPYRFGFECEGFSAHAEAITRERFSFEKGRVRTMLLHGCVYVPFSWDELDKKGQQCRSFLNELLLKYRGHSALKSTLNLYEREVLRYALTLGRPIRMSDMCECLGKQRDFVYQIISLLVHKGLIRPSNSTPVRNLSYIVESHAIEYIR